MLCQVAQLSKQPKAIEPQFRIRIIYLDRSKERIYGLPELRHCLHGFGIVLLRHCFGYNFSCIFKSSVKRLLCWLSKQILINRP